MTTQEILQGVHDWTNEKIVYDISVAHPDGQGNPTKYATLAAALGTNGANIPQSLRKGGMSVKFVQSSDNKYVQYRLMSDSWSINTNDWTVAEDGVYIENPEFVYIKTDAENKIIWAIKTNGDIYYGAGCPQQVKDYVEDKISSLSLDEYEDIVAFLSDYLGSDTTLKVMINGINTSLENKLDAEGLDPEALATVQAVENTEYIQVTTDNEGKVLEGRRANGNKVEYCDIEYPNGIPRDIKEYVDNKTITRVATWGDSITAAGGYQVGIAHVLDIDNSKVVNYGVGSDYSWHVKNRFLSYYQDVVPTKGGDYADYDINKTLEVRKQELKDSFILIFMGTNDLLNINMNPESLPFVNEDYKDIIRQYYPEATTENINNICKKNLYVTKMYAQSYKDSIITNIRDMISIIPHNNWAIITGHGAMTNSGDLYGAMNEIDSIISMMYPNNVIDAKKLLMCFYDYLNVRVSEDFVKPAIGSTVNVTVNDATNLVVGKQLCIGTREKYDIYDFESKSENILTLRLVSTGTCWNVGEIVRAVYPLISDLGRDYMELNTKVFRLSDIYTFAANEFPVTAASLNVEDNVHPSRSYYLLGTLIGKEISKIANNYNIKL